MTNLHIPTKSWIALGIIDKFFWKTIQLCTFRRQKTILRSEYKKKKKKKKNRLDTLWLLKLTE